MADLLSNGLRYQGAYGFTQDGPPTLTGSGVASVSVSFTGAAPLAAAFIKNAKAKSFPRITDDGTLGVYSSGTSLTNAFESVESDGGKVWTKVTLRFLIPGTTTPTKIDEQTIDYGASYQTTTVNFWPTDLTLEINYLAPTATIRWVATSRPAEAKAATPGEELKIDRSWWHRASDGAIQANPFTDYNPPTDVRLLGWNATEVLPGLRWECWATWGRVYLSNYDDAPEA